jgi:hypothetical protein
MESLPDEICEAILNLMSSPSDIITLSMVSKRFVSLSTQHAQQSCLKWWTDNLNFQNGIDLSTTWPLKELVFPLLTEYFSITWINFWFHLRKKIDIWLLDNETDQSFEENNSLNIIRCFEKSSSFLRIGSINVNFWPPDPPGWEWTGFHIKIQRIRTSERYL